MPRPNARPRPRAFSIIELLVVIAVLAILVGILLPVLTKARLSARRAHCSSNLHQISLAIEGYRARHKETYPMARYMPDPFLTIFPDDPSLPGSLEAYMPADNEVYRCPGDQNIVHPLAGISYTYNAALAGRTLDQTWFKRRAGFDIAQVPVAYDCDGNTFDLTGGQQLTVPFFHTLRNLLFADGHVGDYQ